MKRLQSNHLIIKQLLQTTSLSIAGVDEVGRGCIAGPVCAGVVIFNPQSASKLERYVDSKTIPEPRREELSQEILSEHLCAVGWASVEEIDQINIRQAALTAMRRAVAELTQKYKVDESQHLLLIDGTDVIPNVDRYQQYNVIKGDQLVRQISAASIIAKVARDSLMKKFSLEHPEYGFETHKGYGTVTHRKAIEKYGATLHHRKTFAGVKEFLR